MWSAKVLASCAAGMMSGDVRISGHQQEAASFRRVSGYVEQFDIVSSPSWHACIHPESCFPVSDWHALGASSLWVTVKQGGWVLQHSPRTTVGEALWMSARLRFGRDVSNATVRAFILEVRLSQSSYL